MSPDRNEGNPHEGDRLRRGDLLPRMVTESPGPEALRLCDEIRRLEAPGINTLYGDRPNILWREALGSNVLDVDGNLYLDLTAGFGVAALGHRHPRIVEAVRHQSERLLHGLGDAAGHPGRIELARRLCDLSPMDDPRVYLAVSGADALEIAIKTALLAHRGRRSRILAFEPSYHGLTLGALHLSSRPAFRDPFATHLHPHVERLPFACDVSEVERTLRSGDFAALVLEPIVGREGVLVPPTGWTAELSDACSRHGTLLVADEIFTGFGRTGRRWALDHDGTVPDLLCCGKALAGGMPIAAVIGSERVMSAWKTPGEALHTATFVAHPPSCAAACASLDVIEAENLAGRAARLGERVGERLDRWTARYDAVRAVRGRGLLWGFELATAELGGELVHECRQRGILVLVGGPAGRVGQIVPPLTIGEDQLEHALSVIEGVLDRLVVP